MLLIPMEPICEEESVEEPGRRRGCRSGKEEREVKAENCKVPTAKEVTVNLAIPWEKNGTCAVANIEYSRLMIDAAGILS